MTKPSRLAVVALAISVLVSPVRAEDKDPVVAKINDQDVHYSEIVSFAAMNMMGMMPGIPLMAPQVQQPMQPGMFRQFLDQFITTRLLAKGGNDAKLQNNKDVKDRIRASEERIIAAAYIDHVVSERTTDDKVKERYKKMVAEFVPEDQVRLSQIQVPTEDEAKDIIRQLKKGADFAKLAKEKSKDPIGVMNGGDYGYLSLRGLMPQMAEGIKGLKKGEISQAPYKSNFGYHVFKLVDQRKSSPPAFEEAKAQIVNNMRQEISSDVRREIEAKTKVTRFNADGSALSQPTPPSADIPPGPPTAVMKPPPPMPPVKK